MSQDTLFGWAIFLALCAVMALPLVAVLVSDMLDGMTDLWKKD